MHQVKDIIELLNKLNIKYHNKEIYLEALTHSSFIHEYNKVHNKKINNYERLEILGDSVVGKIVTEYFYKKYPDFNEEDINNAKKIIVQNSTMVKASEELHLLDYARLGNGIDLIKGTNKIKEDIFESFIGALYLDQGEQACDDLIKKTIIKYYLNNELDSSTDYKSRIQEIFQSNEYRHGDKKENKIDYHTTPLPDGRFISTLGFNEIIYGKGTGKTKKQAEQQAAKDAWNKLETDANN